MYNITFLALRADHFPLIHEWFNQPHVQAFYSLRTWKLQEVENIFKPHLTGERGINSFIVKINNKNIGYIQYYPLKRHSWPDQDLPVDIVTHAAGLDLFIGDKTYIGKGLGSGVISTFCAERIAKEYTYCLVDPDIRNKVSIRAFVKCGFKEHKQIETEDALGRSVTLLLMIKTLEEDN